MGGRTGSKPDAVVTNERARSATLGCAAGSHRRTDQEPLWAIWQVRQAPASAVRAFDVSSLSFFFAASSTFLALSSHDLVSFSQDSFVPFSGVFLPRASTCSSISLVFFCTSAQSIMSDVNALPTAF